MSSPRDDEIRRILVETADADPVARVRRKRRRVLIISASALVLGGLVTGGSISASTFVSTWFPGKAITYDDMAMVVVGSHAARLDDPFTHTGSGREVIDVGYRPAGSTGVAVAVHCLEAGSFTVTIDDDELSTSTLTCSERDTAFLNGGGQHSVAGGGPHTVTLDSDGARYMVWASWVAEAVPPEPSDEQKAELSDGVVTRDEYLAAFGRFARCMADRGYPLVSIDTSKTVIDYGVLGTAVDAGTDEQCYRREFRDVDIEWQTSR